jgi:co-chaperonin GroES (HSP10)
MPGPELSTEAAAAPKLVGANGEEIKSEPKPEVPRVAADGTPIIQSPDQVVAAEEGTPKLVGPDGQTPIDSKPLPPERDWTQTKFPIELFENRLAIKRDDRDEITKGGLVLSPGAQPRSMTGTVVGVGNGMMKGDGTFIPFQGKPPLQVGDRIVFEATRSMIEVFVEGRSYHITRDNDLLGRAAGGVRIKKENI